MSASPLLITTCFVMCQNFSNVAGFEQNERVIDVRYNSCLVRLVHKKTSFKLTTGKAHAFRQYASLKKICKISACRSHAVRRSMQSPDPTFPFLTFRWSRRHLTRSVCLHGSTNHAACFHAKIVPSCVQQESSHRYWRGRWCKYVISHRCR